MKRKSFTNEFKAKVALEAIKGNSTINEIASEFGVHPNQVNTWKKQLMQGADDVFVKGKSKSTKDVEKDKSRLYEQIGKLQVEVDWLKKKTGHLD
jgi:transposase